ncbi:hypothetical protein ANSO36C_23390 [Nostoc cf. commune SO-36]|uniref:Uncharacterized protein n=1 Tax=Nostoc cf. commune SO-36 TaxID=449208 RepID=A0ABM7Z0R2_NOSCO|nr:hypothetical protein ANSO36C_23390 [Nostoc cf. commune SO-36]
MICDEKGQYKAGDINLSITNIVIQNLQDTFLEINFLNISFYTVCKLYLRHNSDI